MGLFLKKSLNLIVTVKLNMVVTCIGINYDVKLMLVDL